MSASTFRVPGRPFVFLFLSDVSARAEAGTMNPEPRTSHANPDHEPGMRNLEPGPRNVEHPWP